MIELQVSARIYFHGQYDNTCTYYIEIPEGTPEDKEMEVMMEALRPEIEGEYGYYEEWEEGNISWTLCTWEQLNINS